MNSDTTSKDLDITYEEFKKLVKKTLEEIYANFDNLDERIGDTENKVDELDERVEHLESTPDEYDKWHDSQL